MNLEISKLGSINHLHFYIDPTMEDGQIFKGSRTDSNTKWFIGSQKTINSIYRLFLKRSRKLKLEKLNGKDGKRY